MTIDLTALQRILVFVGSPRTGSTLLGQLLNHHPRCMVANEAALLPSLRAADHFGPVSDETLHALASRAIVEREQGLEATERFGPTIGRYQPRWRPFAGAFAGVRVCTDRPILVGDKKAGGAAKAIADDPSWFDALMHADPRLTLLHLTRDTDDAARSLMRSHDYTDPDEARRFVEQLRAVAQGVCERHPDRSVTLDYADLTARPRETLAELAAFLGLEADDAWLDASTAVIAPSSGTS
ncbi:MAG: hypothetical protein Tsb0013_16790 [Phycisphaerales bacterium]